MSPLEKLSSGYSYVENSDGCNVRSVRQVAPGEELRIRLQDGLVTAVVQECKTLQALPGERG